MSKISVLSARLISKGLATNTRLEIKLNASGHAWPVVEITGRPIARLSRHTFRRSSRLLRFYVGPFYVRMPNGSIPSAEPHVLGHSRETLK